MLANGFALVLVVSLELSDALSHRPVRSNHETIISLSSVLGSRLVFDTEDVPSTTITWYRGINELKPLLSNARAAAIPFGPVSTHYQLVNRTKLVIEATSIGDEGFYTLVVGTHPTASQYHLYHVILFTRDLTLSVGPPSHRLTYRDEQPINLTCSIPFYADRSFMEQSRSTFLSSWNMVLYNNDPDHHQLTALSPTAFIYTASLVNYELNRNDHQQRLSCVLVQQQPLPAVILNTTHVHTLNIEYKASLCGDYYSTRSFSSYSTIEINCDEFDANPSAVYTLVWILNQRNQTLLHRTNHGRFVIENATWHHRGHYICFAENYLNENQPVHQSFRLNIWLTVHRAKAPPSFKTTEWQQPRASKSNRLIILSLILTLSGVACLAFLLSLRHFCAQSE